MLSSKTLNFVKSGSAMARAARVLAVALLC